MIKSKLLSVYTVIKTGSTLPILSCVRALNCLQNSMILIPLEPNAGPIGGAGLAWPPLHCSFTKPVISFAIFFDLLVQATFRFDYLVSQIPLFPLIGIFKNFSWGRKDKAGQRIGEVLLKVF